MDAAKSESVPWFFPILQWMFLHTHISTFIHKLFYLEPPWVLKTPKTKPITPVETTFLNFLLVIPSCHCRILSFSVLILSYYSSCFDKYIDKCVRVILMLKKAHAATNKHFLALVVIWSTGVHEERSQRSHSWLRFVKMKPCWNKGTKKLVSIRASLKIIKTKHKNTYDRLENKKAYYYFQSLCCSISLSFENRGNSCPLTDCAIYIKTGILID